MQVVWRVSDQFDELQHILDLEEKTPCVALFYLYNM